MSIANPEIDEVAIASPVHAKRIGLDYRSIKALLDFLLALVMLPIAVPIILLCSLLVILTSRGFPIYTQKRLGLRGKVFTIYKIRTMYQNSERSGGPRWCLPGDRRITPVGHFLRWSHADELPQLINILKGEMSLIGPRPERPELVPPLELALPDYRQRLLVRPGLTGLAQVQLPPDTDLSTVRRKLIYDLCYIEHMNFSLDARLILATVLKCLGVPFSSIRRTVQLPDPNTNLGGESVHAKTNLGSNALVPDPYAGLN